MRADRSMYVDQCAHDSDPADMDNSVCWVVPPRQVSDERVPLRVEPFPIGALLLQGTAAKVTA